jgi:hypothetical protein
MKEREKSNDCCFVALFSRRARFSHPTLIAVSRVQIIIIPDEISHHSIFCEITRCYGGFKLRREGGGSSAGVGLALLTLASITTRFN